MRILLAIDDSECSAAATKAVIAQFTPHHTQVPVLHADEWPKGLAPSMAFAEGSAAAKSILRLHELRHHDATADVLEHADRRRRKALRTDMQLQEASRPEESGPL